jgi:hypothetical protein
MTPERVLKKMMRKEYGESSFPKRVGFVEPGVVFMETHPVSGFVVGYPGVSVSDRSSLMGTVYVSSKQASTPRTSVAYVPADLAARGIVAVKASSKPSSSEPTHFARCSAVGCMENHPSHFCKTCKQWNVKHQWADCPLYKCMRY